MPFGERPHLVVVFDVGGVLCHDALEPKATDLAERYHLEFEDLFARCNATRYDVDEGRMTEGEFWMSALAASGVSPGTEALGVEDYVFIADGVPELLADLTDAGYTLACLTNDSRELAAARQRGISAALGFSSASGESGIFAEVVVSADQGVQKPNPEIFRRLLERLHVNPGQCLFFDDSETNVQAARALGIDGRLYSSVDQVRRIALSPRTCSEPEY